MSWFEFEPDRAPWTEAQSPGTRLPIQTPHLVDLVDTKTPGDPLDRVFWVLVLLLV